MNTTDDLRQRFGAPWPHRRQGISRLYFDLGLRAQVGAAPPRYRCDEYPTPISFQNHFLLMAHELRGFTPLFDRPKLATVSIRTPDTVVDFTRQDDGGTVLSYAFPAYGPRVVVLRPDAEGYERFAEEIVDDLGTLYLHLNCLMEIVHRLRLYFPA